jgi:hypothetical protein
MTTDFAVDGLDSSEGHLSSPWVTQVPTSALYSPKGSKVSELAIASRPEQSTDTAMRGTALAGVGGDLRKPANRARGAALTPRDVEVLRYVTRHGVCTGEQLARRFFAGSSAVWRRLRILEGLGLISRHRTWWQGPRVITATTVGNHLGAVDLATAHLNLPELEHALSVVDLSEALLATHPGSRWVTERELRRDAIRAHRADGMEPRAARVRTADGMLIMGERCIAVELDLTNKRTEVYEQLLRSYSGAKGIDAVWWYGRSAAMRSRLSGLVAQFQLTNFVQVAEWNGAPHGPDFGLGG